MKHTLNLMIMSGVDDGTLLEFDTSSGEGDVAEDRWTLQIGRRDDNHIVLKNDTYVSRRHASLHWKNERWWLEDYNSTNGTFQTNEANFFDDTPVKGIVPLEVGELFRVGRTWMRIQPVE